MVSGFLVETVVWWYDSKFTLVLMRITVLTRKKDTACGYTTNT